MAKVILICGKICCGKTTYSEQIREKENAVILSVDEIMLSIFGQHAGEKHDEYANNTQKYLFDKSIEFVNAGETDAYFVDENLANKFAAIFETPDKDEIDVWSRV